MESKAAVLGSTDFVMPFRALGIDSFPVEADRDSVIRAGQAVAAGGYGLIIVAENIALLADEVLGSFSPEPIPCVIVMPLSSTSTNFAVKSLGMALKLATGIDIMKTQ